MGPFSIRPSASSGEGLAESGPVDAQPLRPLRLRNRLPQASAEGSGAGVADDTPGPAGSPHFLANGPFFTTIVDMAAHPMLLCTALKFTESAKYVNKVLSSPEPPIAGSIRPRMLRSKRACQAVTPGPPMQAGGS